jgi:hypothetical protein
MRWQLVPNCRREIREKTLIEPANADEIAT